MHCILIFTPSFIPCNCIILEPGLFGSETSLWPVVLPACRVGWPVCHNFCHNFKKKGREVSLSCSYRSTCFITSRNYCWIKTLLDCFFVSSERLCLDKRTKCYVHMLNSGFKDLKFRYYTRTQYYKYIQHYIHFNNIQISNFISNQRGKKKQCTQRILSLHMRQFNCKSLKSFLSNQPENGCDEKRIQGAWGAV